MSSTPAWIAFAAAIIVAGLTGVSGYYLHYVEKENTRNYEILQERKKALFDALKVIDYVYANEPLAGKPPLNPRTWDITLARDAANRILIYCENPNTTLTSFYKAIGLHNPQIESAPGINLKSLDEFRREVARELNLPELKFTDPDRAWIYSLSGTIEAENNKALEKAAK